MCPAVGPNSHLRYLSFSLVASHPHLSHLTSSQPHWPSHHSLNTPITFPPSSLHTGHSLSRMIFLYPAAAKSLQSCPTLCDLIDGSPPGSPVPWDSPGKNTGVGCHFLLQCMKVKSESEVAQSCLTLSDPMDCSPTRLLHPWDFPGKSTGVGCHCLLHFLYPHSLFLYSTNF